MSQTSVLTQTSTTHNSFLIPDNEIYTLDELVKRRASELRDSPLLGYPRQGLTDYEEHSAAALDKYVDAAAAALQLRGLTPVVSTSPRTCTETPLAFFVLPHGIMN